MMEIRSARLEDLPKLLEFEKEIAAYERNFDESLKKGEIHYYDLKEFIKSSDVEVLVAEIEKEVVGSGYAKIIASKPYEKTKEFGYLGFMYVKPIWRRKGINKKIVNHLIEWLRSRGVLEVRLNVYNENKVATEAYAKIGFKTSSVEMRMSLD